VAHPIVSGSQFDDVLIGDNATTSTVVVSSETNVIQLFIMIDVSSSMNANVSGVSRFTIIKNALNNLFQEYNSFVDQDITVNISLATFAC